ncbi:MAG: hypothetical protein J3K34DRAFT_221745 [Monoraphidium minutum]|nr:MAG: hypothetical protein J3K34DRAFT_221745 [Monoraphidium minutum]
MGTPRWALGLGVLLLGLLGTATAQQCYGYGGSGYGYGNYGYGYGGVTYGAYGSQGRYGLSCVMGNSTPPASSSVLMSGGVADAEGTLTPFGPDLLLRTSIFTDDAGVFRSDVSTPALVVVPPGYTDVLTGAPV